MQISTYGTQPSNSQSLPLTKHAFNRMCERGMSEEAVSAALEYGRDVFVRGAMICAIGRKEVHRYGQKGIDLAQYEGVQVVCCPKSGDVLTVYRNHDFRGLRPRRRGRCWQA